MKDNFSGMDLFALRKKIDEIDEQILSLINKRFECVIEIGKWKKNKSQAVYAPEREKEILSRLEKINRGPIKTKALNAIFDGIISESRELEHSLTTTACAKNNQSSLKCKTRRTNTIKKCV